MRIYIETAGGGGVVLLVAIALLAGHGSGVSAALAAVVIALAIVVALAVGGLIAYLVYRARHETRPAVQLRQPVRGEVLGPSRSAIESVRLHPEQLAELAEIIRRAQRPEQ